jgi:hypothetical protein
VTDFQHTVGIRELYADQTGSRLIVVDDRSEGYVFSPVSVVLCYRSDLSLHGEAKACCCATMNHLEHPLFCASCRCFWHRGNLHQEFSSPRFFFLVSSLILDLTGLGGPTRSLSFCRHHSRDHGEYVCMYVFQRWVSPCTATSVWSIVHPL